MSNKEIALQIVHFLQSSIKEIDEDYVDSIDVAVDCIADAFGVDKQVDGTKAFNGQSLKDILSAAKSKTDAIEIPVKVDEKANEINEATKEKAEALKLEGNKAVAAKNFQTAVEKYSAAIDLDSNNPVYFSNRAAAYSSLRDHENAVKDAKSAIGIDPNYSKAYSRLGLASYALNKPRDALDAYKRGLETEGDKPSDSMKRGYETAKKRVEEQLNTSNELEATEASSAEQSTPASGAGGLPDLSNLASMLGGSGGAGGAGGAGGMPNFADMLNNPALMQAAQQMMQDPNALANLMSNPAIQQMASQFGLGRNN
ncbi:hypothetical protein WICMUC_003825 [Wickerhamomyces mucosus]|uniref:SGTA homodimerisation domain-containing protein n=1 Tax=Wickerhamomyces mucosus TaxID=1378264 RepID=A0A9P8PJZ0_9ASCO|nr:hypothetical protein WICMUC_003825 [Wickerhamomyces mucosus]